MAYAHIEHPIVLRRSQPLLIPRGSAGSDADTGHDQPDARHRQEIVEPLPPGWWQRAEARSEADQPLPPECWYG